MPAPSQAQVAAFVAAVVEDFGRIVGRINQAPLLNVASSRYVDDLPSYETLPWQGATIRAANGNVAGLPQTRANLVTQNGTAPT